MSSFQSNTSIKHNSLVTTSQFRPIVDLIWCGTPSVAIKYLRTKIKSSFSCNVLYNTPKWIFDWFSPSTFRSYKPGSLYSQTIEIEISDLSFKSLKWIRLKQWWKYHIFASIFQHCCGGSEEMNNIGFIFGKTNI